MTDPASEDPTTQARRALGSVLWKLGVLDLSVVVIVVAIALLARPLHLSAGELLGAILAAVGAILATRVVLAAQLRHRATREQSPPDARRD